MAHAVAGQLSGALHTAGLLADRLVSRLEAQHVASLALTPKAGGAALLGAAAANVHNQVVGEISGEHYTLFSSGLLWRNAQARLERRPGDRLR